jgi:hypothetical protein
MTLLAAVGALLTVAFAAAPQADAATIYACVKKKSGTARFVSQKSKCRKNEVKLSWNTTGNNGTNGKNGANGANGAQGPAGKDGAPGAIGPSFAFNTNSGEDILNFPASANEVLTVSSISLPAGNFSVLGKVVVNNNAATTVEARCELILGATTIDSGFDGIFLGEAPADREYLMLAGTGKLSGPGTAKIVCKVSSTSGNYLDRSITAIQVGSLG